MRKLFVSSALIAAAVAITYYFYATLPDVAQLRYRNPKITALMELRERQYKEQGVREPRRHVWVRYSAISEHLKKAVLVSEDAAFFSHGGIDFHELRAAFEKVWETWSFSRGGSTITMQLARNLYLSPSKSPLRKLREILIARRLEESLSKQRIFEIYLNIVELGYNLYGVEAGARFYFGKSSALLNPVEAATLAALLPNPRSPRRSSIINRRNLILTRLASIGYLGEEESRRARETPLLRGLPEA